ncbi:MAG: Gfo/Idh/MocA family oxidoreductase [Actinobacteria bacterium]|nr:Gfo/Idh/MocA family oxidoreductase [Actinomycetota bacterium]
MVVETKRKLRLGIIGCGDMESAHQGIFDKISDLIEVTATADIDLDRAKNAANASGAKLWVQDYRDLLDHVDAVLIATPHDLHHEMGIAALRAGKHVLMEKPMAVNEEECLDLIATSYEVGKTLMIAYPMRFQPLVIKLKELVDNKYMGEIFHVGIFTEQLTEPPIGSWIRSAKHLGGGQFFSHGCHYVDLLLWFLGNPEIGVHIGTRLGTPWMEKEGTSDAVITFKSGAIGHHFGTWGARATRHGYTIHVHGEKGMLEADITNGILYAHHGFAGTPPRGGIGGTLSPNVDDAEIVLQVQAESKYLQGELRHFAECISNGVIPLTSGQGSLQGLRAIWLMEEAEQELRFADLRGLSLNAPWEEAKKPIFVR